MSNAMMITEDHFSVAQMRLTTNDPAQLDEERRFVQTQADAANRVRACLGTFDLASEGERMETLVWLHDALRLWRYTMAVKAELSGLVQPSSDEYWSLERRLPAVPLRLGAVGALRDGARWDAQQRTFVGGEPTPASRLAEELGQRALELFALRSPDALELREDLADRNDMPDAFGAVLLRGDAARQALEAYAQQKAGAGRSADGIDLGGGEPLCVVPGQDPYVCHTLRYEALRLLSLRGDYDVSHWAGALYLLAHGWLDLGHEDVYQMFAVTTGAEMFGAVPKLPSDCALRALVTSREAFVQEIVALQG